MQVKKVWQWGAKGLLFLVFFIGAGMVKPLLSTKTLSTVTATSPTEQYLALYETLKLDSLGLSHQAFTYALTGFEHLQASGKVQKDNLLSILDFSLPSGKKRLFVIDMASGELVFYTYAAHGRNSGKSIAENFSNTPNSYQSSLGFYITGETYIGKHGSSLRLLGEERGFNDNALARGIVMHGADYVDESIVHSQGYIGRSQGCPALPGNISSKVIEKIKDGSCLFLYSPDKYYASHSSLLNGKA